jgi:hypothetical protein
MTRTLTVFQLARRLLADFACAGFGAWCLRNDLAARDTAWAVFDAAFTLALLWFAFADVHYWRSPPAHGRYFLVKRR